MSAFSRKTIEDLERLFSENGQIIHYRVDYISDRAQVPEELSSLTMPYPLIRAYAELSPESGSLIRVEVWLPENWNGNFLGLGNGGMAGGIPYATLSEFTVRGFAAATTDMGTSRGVASGIRNPAVPRDFGHRATHLMTVIGQSAAACVYGLPARYSLFRGGSTGGEQALSEAQRYPEDYDAILCGAPANNRICLHTYFLWNFVHLKSRMRTPLFDAPTCLRITECAVRFAQRTGMGSADDNFLTFPLSDIRLIEAFLAELDQVLALTTEQKAALRAVYDGPKNPRTGARIYNGIPFGSEMYGCGLLDCAQGTDSPHDYLFYWALGEKYDPFAFDFDRDLDRVQSILSPDMDANNPDLTPFFRHGGKILILSAAADPCVPFPDTYAYVRRVLAACGEKQAEQGLRFYMVPALDHSISQLSQKDIQAEDGRDLLSVLLDWRSDGKAPEQLRAFLHGFEDSHIVERHIQPVGLRPGAAPPCPPTAAETYLGK